MARPKLSPQRISRLGPAIRELSQPLRILSLILFLLWLIPILILPTVRIATLEARTQGMMLEFQGGNQKWQIEGATLCRPLEAAPCPLAPLDVLAWPDGTQVEITRPPGVGKLIMTILSDGITGLPKDSRIEFDDAAFRDNGQQYFRGFVSLGAEPGSARRGYLWESDYRFLSRDVFSAFWGSSAVPIREGDLVQGDRVSVICTRASIDGQCDIDAGDKAGRMMVFGHVVLELSTDEKPGFDVVATSGRGDIALRVDRFGVGSTSDAGPKTGITGWWPFASASPATSSLIIRPNVVDMILTSPTLLAASLILTLLAGWTQSFDSGQPRRSDEPPRAAPGGTGLRKSGRNPARPPRAR